MKVAEVEVYKWEYGINIVKEFTFDKWKYNNMRFSVYTVQVRIMFGMRNTEEEKKNQVSRTGIFKHDNRMNGMVKTMK